MSSALEKRVSRLERLLSQAIVIPAATFELQKQISPIVSSDLIGTGKRHRLPDFWSDSEVRETIIELHRQVSIVQLHQRLKSQFGIGRTPSESAIHRFWQKLDQLTK